MINAAKVKIYTRLFARKKANNFNSDNDYTDFLTDC